MEPQSVNDPRLQGVMKLSIVILWIRAVVSVDTVSIFHSPEEPHVQLSTMLFATVVLYHKYFNICREIPHALES